jgi:fluoride exporter
MTPYLLIGLGGAIGAMLRFAMVSLVGFLPNGFPMGTLLVNILGSLAMGVLVGALAKWTPEYQEQIRLFVAVGLFGGFTTFSSFSLDTIVLIERGELLLAAAYVIGSALLAIAGLWAGLAAVRVLA